MNNEICINKQREEFNHFLNLIKNKEKYSIKINYVFAPLRECCQKTYDVLMKANVDQYVLKVANLDTYGKKKENLESLDHVVIVYTHT